MRMAARFRSFGVPKATGHPAGTIRVMRWEPDSISRTLAVGIFMLRNRPLTQISGLTLPPSWGDAPREVVLTIAAVSLLTAACSSSAQPSAKESGQLDRPCRVSTLQLG